MCPGHVPDCVPDLSHKYLVVCIHTCINMYVYVYLTQIHTPQMCANTHICAHTPPGYIVSCLHIHVEVFTFVVRPPTQYVKIRNSFMRNGKEKKVKRKQFYISLV